MNDFEEDVQYFIDLVKNNINVLKTNKPRGISKEELIFFNWSMSQDGQEITVYNQEKDFVYEILTKTIKEFYFQKVNKEEVLNLITLLKLYSNQEITVKNFIKRYEKAKEEKAI